MFYKKELVPHFRALTSVAKKTLILAEGLDSYFDSDQFELYLTNISTLLKTFENGEFYSHRQTTPPGIFYKILRQLVSVITHSKNQNILNTPEDLQSYLEKSSNFKFLVDKSQPDLFFYSLSKNS